MCIHNATAPPLWPIYDTIQRIADPQVLNSRAFGRDEQLSEILDRIESGTSISQESIESLERNRARKFRRQKQILLEKIAGWDQVVDPGNAAFNNAVVNEQIDWVRQNSSFLEYLCLWALASGKSYSQLSVGLKLKPATLRSLVSRCRSRLRDLALAA